MRYPIGNQDFRSLRAKGFVYVDKTEHICRIPDAGEYFFLSRPRRFGKSLTVSTLKELYSGDRELFQGLWAYDNWSFAERQRPVIHIKFDESGFQTSGLPVAINQLIDYEAKRLGVAAPTPSADYGRRFRALVEAVAGTHPSGRCVVLIDEYDKPIINYLSDLVKAKANRDALRSFYGVLKPADEYIELVFITGVSAFSKVSLFSDLNNIRQLTLDPLAHTLAGLTEAELDAYFATQLDATGFTREQVRHWYNGYTWGGERVYNPWSLLNFLGSGQLDNFWSTSGTPKFVTDLLAREGVTELDGEQRSPTQLTGFDLDNLDAAAVLWQGGYFTLDASERGRLRTLRYPNAEVHETFTEALLHSYGFNRVQTNGRALRMGRALRAGDLYAFGEEVDALLAGIPYELWQDATERFYRAVVLTAFRYVGMFDARAEVSSARGRADVVLELPQRVYVLEFKLLRPTAAQLADDSARAAAAEALAGEALAQIEERGYAKPYATDARKVSVVAVVFDAERRRVAVVREG